MSIDKRLGARIVTMETDSVIEPSMEGGGIGKLIEGIEIEEKLFRSG